jgi:hypothetical protein
LTAGACGGPKALTLPADPIDRAATCGVVAAGEARLATADIKAPLSFEAQGRIVHYALLAASEGEEFAAETANAVSKRMTEIHEQVTKGKWRELGPACDAAFPATAKAEVGLPEGRLDSLLGCDELAHFMMTALEQQEADYANELGEYRGLRSDLERPLVPVLRARAGSGPERQQQERRRVLPMAAKLGPPVAVLAQCLKRYGKARP